MSSNLKTQHLTLKLFLWSLLVTLTIGFFTGYKLISEIRGEIFRNHINSSLTTQRILLTGKINKSDFQPGNTRLARSRFHDFVKKTLLSNGIKAIKIWSPDGRLVYSSAKKLVGKKYRITSDLGGALSGKTNIATATDILETRSTDHKKVLEIYSPIYSKGKVVGAFETYYSMKPVNTLIQRISFYTALFLSGGLFCYGP